jgi:hypothetical protein
VDDFGEFGITEPPGQALALGRPVVASVSGDRSGEFVQAVLPGCQPVRKQSNLVAGSSERVSTAELRVVWVVVYSPQQPCHARAGQPPLLENPAHASRI